MSLLERLRDERGYTLVELMMATAAGLVVSAAALAIVISSLSFSTNDPERVDANQQGGLAMEQIVQALGSSCVEGYGVSPVVGATGGTGLTGSTGAPVSGANSITFFSSSSDQPSITPNELAVYLSGGALYMATYSPSTVTGASGTTSSVYPRNATRTVTLLAHAANATGSSGVFSYYGYDASSGVISTAPFSTPLNATNAANTAQIGVSFQAQPSDGQDPVGGAVDLSDSVVLRLSAVSNILPTTGSTTPQPCA